MKLASLIILISVVMACKNPDNSPEGNALTGKWEWLQSNGGYAGTSVSSSENNRKQLVFTSDGHHELIENGQSKMRVDYVIKNGKSITSNKSVPLIYFRSDKIYQSFHIKSDTLFLTDEVYDGYSHAYLRIL